MENSWRGGPGQGREEPGEEQPGASSTAGGPCSAMLPTLPGSNTGTWKSPLGGRIVGRQRAGS